MEGWVKLHRKLTESEIWTSEPFTRGQAWVDLIMLANHDYGFFYLRDHKVEVQRGQVGWSQQKLAERWRWSRTKVRKFLNDLEKEQQLIQQQSFSTSILTLINYDIYQEKEQLGIQQEDSRKTAEKQQEDTNKNDKNKKKEKNEKKESLLQLVFPFDSPEFMTRWGQWKEYKKQQHRFTYKCEKTEQAALKQLGELAGGQEWVALRIIEQSIANGWQGLFELKNQTNGKPGNGNNGGRRNGISDLDRTRLANDLLSAVNKGTNS